MTSSIKKCISSFFYIFFKIIGLSPFSIRTNNSKKKFIPPVLGSIYNTCLMVLTLYLSIGSISSIIYEVDYPYKNETSQLILTTKAITGIIVLLITWFWFSLRQQKMARIANQFVTIDITFERLKHIIDISSFFTFQIILIFSFNLIIWISVVWTDFVLFPEYMRLTIVTIFLPNFIFNWLIMQYSFVLISLFLRFCAINELIKRLSRIHFALRENSAEDEVTNDLKVIKEIHTMLYYVSCDICSFYSLPMLLTITVICGGIIYTSYYLVSPFLLGTNSLTGLITFNSVVYIVMEVFPLASMSFGVTRVINEMGITSDIVHQLLARSVIGKKLKSELKLFSLELLHRNVAFTACDVFPIDCTLLHSIFNTTATYLVILIQLKTGKKENKNEII